MPRDLENFSLGYPNVKSSLTVNPYPKQKEVKKKKKGNDKKGVLAANNLLIKKIQPLVCNEKFEYRPFEFGNYPLRADGKPISGVWRLMLPSEADWSNKVTVIDKDKEKKETNETKSPKKKK